MLMCPNWFKHCLYASMFLQSTHRTLCRGRHMYAFQIISPYKLTIFLKLIVFNLVFHLYSFSLYWMIYYFSGYLLFFIRADCGVTYRNFSLISHNFSFCVYAVSSNVFLLTSTFSFSAFRARRRRARKKKIIESQNKIPHSYTCYTISSGLMVRVHVYIIYIYTIYDAYII